jgi:two-component system CheB/CheR fusion protein
VDADATRISQIVGNLLQNAAKFTPPGGTARVSVRPAGPFAELRVADDGIGLADARRLFEPLGRAAQGPGNEKGGLGLGLAIVKGLAELHGGSVSAHSDGPGRGCEVTVRLPLAAAAPPAERAERAEPAEAHGPAEPPPPARPAVAPRAARRLVLIIEDNVDAARSLADLLELDGHRVEVVNDGRSGIARARQLRPDAVVCDLGLPDVDGYEVARAIRADPSLEATCLIAVSGYAQPDDRRRALEAGFRAHLAKPASLEALHALLAETPNATPTPPPTPTPTPTPTATDTATGSPGIRSR